MPSRPDPTRWYGALASLVVAGLLAWLLGDGLDLTSGERTALQVGLIALGLVAAVAILYYLRPTDAPPPIAADPARDDALVAIAAARARLPRGALQASPLLLVVGVDGSDSTTVVTRSGMDPELMAGDAVGDEPVPTANANVWKVRGAVVVEAGAPLVSDGERWGRFVRALRAPRVAAAIGRGEAAPRAAVVCVSCGVFYGAGGAQIDPVAQLLRQRLSEVANDWGLALPVYVLFTQADLVPHFEAWAAPLTREEARAPLGAALPFDASAGAAGSHAERLMPRVEAAFREIAETLAGWRLALLARESVVERRFAAYELPREIGKLAPAATRFLTELCRPTQLGTSPALRGFYFVGVRPVVVGDVGAPMAVAASAPAMRASDATGVFSQPGAPAPTATPFAALSARRVPQWTFLERLFPEVILADRGAVAAARGGTRVSGLRRALLGVGIAASIVAAVGVVRSWRGNQALADRTAAAAGAVATLSPVRGTVASAESIERLDALRGVLDTVQTHERDGVPFRLTWGLWRGPELLREGRRVWLAGYRDQLHEPAWGTLAESLRALPDTAGPAADYARAYADLRAYLVTTSEWARAMPEMVAPVLARRWAREETPPDVVALAERQFAFYADILPQGNPFPRPPEDSVVRRARRFLASFGGTERIYQAKVADASQRFAAARITPLAPQAPSVLVVPADVPGAFTAASWRFMDSTFRDTSVVAQGDAWVLGNDAAALVPDRAVMLAELQRRYRSEYVQRWRDFVGGARVRPSADLGEAVSKLGVIRGSQSPTLAVLALTARNTAIDSAMIVAFQPVHHVSPPKETEIVSEKSRSYVSALGSLLSAVDQVAKMPPGGDSLSIVNRSQSAQQVLTMQAVNATTAALDLASGFASDSAAARVGPTVDALLRAPIEMVASPLRVVAGARPRPTVAAGGGGGDPPPVIAKRINDRAADLCTAMRPLLDKFPFAPDATRDASLAEVKEVLAPAGSRFAELQAQLDGVLVKQGGRWVPDPDARVTLSPTFLRFINRASLASAGLFHGGSAEPRVEVTARGMTTRSVKSIQLMDGGKVALLRAGMSDARLTWPSGGQPTRVRAVLVRGLRPDEDRAVANAIGDWALFKVAARAAWGAGDERSTATWRVGGDEVKVEFLFEDGAPVLKRGWLGEMGCVPKATP